MEKTQHIWEKRESNNSPCQNPIVNKSFKKVKPNCSSTEEPRQWLPQNLKNPEQFDNAVMKRIPKKGGTANLNNYRQISLLSHMYKLDTKIITNQLMFKLAIYQSREQAGFRSSWYWKLSQKNRQIQRNCP